MSDPPGMLVAAIGTVDGIEFTLSNETDQDITVSLFVTPGDVGVRQRVCAPTYCRAYFMVRQPI